MDTKEEGMAYCEIIDAPGIRKLQDAQFQDYRSNNNSWMPKKYWQPSWEQWALRFTVKNDGVIYGAKYGIKGRLVSLKRIDEIAKHGRFSNFYADNYEAVVDVTEIIAYRKKGKMLEGAMGEYIFSFSTKKRKGSVLLPEKLLREASDTDYVTKVIAGLKVSA